MQEEHDDLVRITITVQKSVSEVISRIAKENRRARKNQIEWILNQYANRQLKAEKNKKI